jgi:hypothetical protein
MEVILATHTEKIRACGSALAAFHFDNTRVLCFECRLVQSILRVNGIGPQQGNKKVYALTLDCGHTRDLGVLVTPVTFGRVKRSKKEEPAEVEIVEEVA